MEYTIKKSLFAHLIIQFRTGVKIMESMTNRIQMIPLSKLRFDPSNPRLPQELQGVQDEVAVIAHMLRDESLIELMKSIAQTGYSASEPLLVVANEDAYVVVEGNRRLSALKLLSNPTLATIRCKSVEEVVNGEVHKPNMIPCIQYPARDDILDYLGYRHITGVKSWGALEKARYLQQLYNRYSDENEPTEVCYALARMIGSRRDYVARLLASYALYERANNNAYFGVDIQERDVEFSLLSTALGYEGIYKFIGLESAGDFEAKNLDEDNFEFLFRCLYDPQKKISESRQLRLLNRVLGNAQALEQYKNGASLQVATYYTSEPVEAFKRLLNDAYDALKTAGGSVEKITVSDDDFSYIDSKLQDIRKLALTVKVSIQALLDEDIE